MNDIFRLNINLLRKRLKIYGFFNILSLFLVIALILSGIKFVQHMMGNYQENAMFELVVIFTLFSSNIFPKNYEKKCGTVKTYFPAFNMNDIESYYSRINLLFYEVSFIFMLFPTSKEDTVWFIIFTAINNVLLLGLIFIKQTLSSSSYASFSNILKSILCIFIFICMRGIIPLPSHINVSTPLVVLLIIVALFAFYKCLILIKYQSMVLTSGVLFLRMTKKARFLNRNHDLLRIFRKNDFISAIILVLLSNVSISGVIEQPQDRLWIYMLSLLGAYLTIYLDLLADEKGKGIFFYCLNRGTEVKLLKIRSTVYASVLMLPILLIVLLAVLDLKTIIVGYVISVIVFVLGAAVYRIKLDKDDFKVICTGLQGVLLGVILAVCSWVVNYKLILTFIV